MSKDIFCNAHYAPKYLYDDVLMQGGLSTRPDWDYLYLPSDRACEADDYEMEHDPRWKVPNMETIND